MRKQTVTTSRFLQSAVPLIAFIGVFLGILLHHFMTNDPVRSFAGYEHSGPGTGGVFVENDRSVFGKNVYAQDYEPMKAVIGSGVGLEKARMSGIPVSSMRNPSGQYGPDAFMSLNRLKNYIVTLQRKASGLQEKLDALNGVLKEKDEQIGTAHQTNAELQSAVVRLETELKAKSESLSALDARAADQFRYFNEKIQLLNQLLVSRQQEINRLKTEKNKLVTDFNRLLETNAHLKNKFEINVNNLNGELARRQQTDEEIRAARQSHAQLQSTIVRLETGLKAKSESLSALDARAADQFRYFNEKIQLLNQLLVSRQQEINRLKTEKNKLVTDFNRLLETRQEVKNTTELPSNKPSEEKTVSRLEVPDLAMIKFVKFGLEEQIDQLTDQVVELKHVRVKLEDELRSVRQEKADLENQVGLLKAALAQQEQENKAFQATISELRSSLEKKAHDMDTLDVPYQDLQAEVSRLRVIRDEYEQRIEALTERSAKLGVSGDDSHQEVLRLTALITRNEVEKEFALQEKAQEVLAINGELDQAKTHHQSLMDIIAQKDQTLQEYKTRTLDTLKDKMRALNAEVAAHKKSQARLNKELSRLKSLNEHLYRRMKKMHMELELRRAR